MSDVLVNHALNHIWAAPLQDCQHRIKPNRVSPEFGFFKEAKVMWERIPLPNYKDSTDTTSYHVYPLGQLPPFLFALIMQKRTWYRVDQIGMANSTVIDIYLDNGAIVPRHICYLYLNTDNNFILAIARNVIDYGSEIKKSPYNENLTTTYTPDHHGVTIRFYNNALTKSNEWLDSAADPSAVLQDHFAVIDTVSDYNSFMARVTSIRTKYQGQGKGVFFLNGFIISEPTGYNTAMKGGTLRFQYDETVKDIRMFPISTIVGFRSTVDRRTDKYILLPETNDDMLEFFDDSDYYVVLKRLDGSYRGVRLDNFGIGPIRQLTHNAVSIKQDLVVNRSDQHEFLSNLNNLTILMVVRHGGMVRDMGLQRNRIEDLYHLPRAQILEAMAGATAGVDEWRAEQLENSAYIEVMSSKFADITQAMVEEAYGYNAATKSVARALYPVINGQVTVDEGMCIPWDVYTPTGNKIQTRRTLFWYDADGILLTYTSNNTTSRTINAPAAIRDTAKKVELILGELVVGQGDIGEITNQMTVPDNAYGYFGYRNYVIEKDRVNTSPVWTDVTNGIYCNLVTPSNGSAPYVQWNQTLLDNSNFYPCTRFANKVNVYTTGFSKASTATFSGVLDYTMMQIQNSALMPIHVPFGHVDVFMNGESLIQGLDYHYITGGKIVVVKKPTVDIDEITLTIRGYGFMNPNTKEPFTPRDQGFIKNGLLSANQTYNVCHDRDIRVIVDGKLKFPDEVRFAETGSSVTGDLILDGKPYAVTDYQTLVEPFTKQNTVDYLMDAIDIDERVSAYLTPRLPEPEITDEYITPLRHEVYSPIMATFIRLIETGSLLDNVIDQDTMDQAILTKYGYIMEMHREADPVYLDYNLNYCAIYPHPYLESVEVTSKQYAFLERVNRVFLKGALDLTQSVRIKSGT